jgi:hypothetical protein
MPNSVMREGTLPLEAHIRCTQCSADVRVGRVLVGAFERVVDWWGQHIVLAAMEGASLHCTAI